MPSITLNQKKIDYTIRRSKRTKNIKISIKSEGQVVVSLSPYAPDFVAKQFLKENEKWVLKKLSGIPSIAKTVFKEGQKLNFLGQKFYELKLFTSKGKRSFLREHFRELHFFQGSDCEDLQSEIRLHLEGFYREKARMFLTKRVSFFTNQLGVEFNKIFIKNQQTRWGSCSGKKNLNFNWRIILASKEIIDYLVIHEVCHLKEMNHGKKFWRLVESLDSDFERHREFLNKKARFF